MRFSSIYSVEITKVKLQTRVFPNVHQEVMLGMPWLIQENPLIDCAQGQVQMQ